VIADGPFFDSRAWTGRRAFRAADLEIRIPVIPATWFRRLL